MTRLRIISVTFFFLLTQCNALSQGHPLERLYYEKTIGKNEFIIGKEYLSYYFRSNTTPLLNNGKEYTGTLIIRGRTFRGVKLQYDTFLDEVVFTSRDTMINFQYPKIALNKEIIDSFTLEDEYGTMVFIKPEVSGSSSGLMKAGFYEMLREGNCTLLIRHQSKSYRNQAVYEYRYAPEYFISTENKYFSIKNKNDIKTGFGPDSEKILEFLKSSDMNIRKADKNMLTKVMRFYNSLKKGMADEN